MAGVIVDESHFASHRFPLEMAFWMASVSSVEPSPAKFSIHHYIRLSLAYLWRQSPERYEISGNLSNCQTQQCPGA